MTDAAKRVPLALLPFAVMFLALMFAGVVLEPPPVRAPPAGNEFDANAARSRYARVLGAETPHAVDTASEDALRERLLTEIRALHLSPQVHASFACRPNERGPYVTCALVRNIIFSIGPASGPAILAAAHYDSVPAGPGASDDGIGVSSWLEIARVLSREHLQRRVIFLLTDGEEGGLIGAYAFSQEPEFASVQAIVNLEARGTRGPAIFFETNEPNADAVTAYASVARPVANSVAADIYHLLPNSTDVSTLTRPGLDVINVSVIDGLENYHTPHDTLANADLASLQHMGDTGLAVTRRLASAPDGGRTGSLVYSDIAGRLFVSMPVLLAQVLLGVSVLIALFAFWRSSAEARWRTLAAPIAGVTAAGVISAAIDFALGLIFPGRDFGFANPEPMRAWVALIALVGPLLALMLLRAGAKAEQIEAAAFFWFALLGFALSIALPGSAILFVLPIVPYAIGALASHAWKPAQMIGALLAALVALVLWTPTLHLFELSLGFGLPFALCILDAILALTWLGLAARLQGSAPWRATAIVLGGLAAIFVAASLLTPAATHAKPQPLNISYFLDTAENQAFILAGSASAALPPALHGFRAQTLIPGDQTDTWVMPTEAAPFTPPVLENISVSNGANGEHIFTARLKTNGAHRVIIRMPIDAHPLRGALNGAAINFTQTGPADGDDMLLGCEGRACDGASVSITFGASASGDWYLIGQFPGAPVPAAVTAMRTRRPDSAVPIQYGDGATTLTPFEVRPDAD